MGKSNRRSTRDGEPKENRRLKLENQKLRKQISALRKQLNRIDIDRYQSLKDTIEAQENEDNKFDTDFLLQELKRKWECHTCARDYLRLVIVPRIDGTKYLRRCPTCLYKTRLKPYTDDIEGITSDEQIYSKDSK